MNRIKKVGKMEFMRIKRRFESCANIKAAAAKVAGFHLSAHAYFSDLVCPMHEDLDMFRAVHKKDVEQLYHFTVIPCSALRIGEGMHVNCLAIVKEEDGKLRYYYSVHEYGDCPFKTFKSEVEENE